METKLIIGIADSTPGWQEYLSQTGVRFEVVDFKSGELTPSTYSALIINRPLAGYEAEAVKTYVFDGGGVIDCGYVITRISQGRLTEGYCTTIMPESVPFLPPLGCLDVYAVVKRFSRATHLQKTIYSDTYGKGVISFCGIDLIAALGSARSSRKEFYSFTPRFPNEEVSSVSKGEFSRLFFYLLRRLHVQRGLPFVHTWFFPGKASNVSLVRIDSDYGSPEQIKRWQTIGEKTAIPFTWFVHVAAHEGWLSRFSEFSGHEIAVHGYDHFFSPEPGRNEHNILKALGVLEKRGFHCTGYASPYGLWNTSLQKMCEKLGFYYTSEFSYVYDSLPLRPVVDGRICSAIQIPIHPICIGSLLNTRSGDSGIVDYYEMVMAWHRMHFIPTIFYDHVLHPKPELFGAMVRLLDRSGGKPMCFTEFATFWNNRSQIAWNGIYDETRRTIEIRVAHTTLENSLCIWYSDTNYALVPVRDVILDRQAVRERTVRYNRFLNLDIAQNSRRFRLRLLKQSLLNSLFWRKKS